MRDPSDILFPTAGALALFAAASAPGQVQYTITDLTELAEPLGVIQSQAEAINEAGQIVGFEVVSLAVERAIFWDADGTVQLLSMIPDDNSNIAAGIGEDGTILGLSELVTITQIGQIIIIDEDQKAAMWQNGQLTNINDLVTNAPDIELFFARDMNDAGRIVGFAGLLDPPPFNSNGFLFDNGVVTDLGMLQRPQAINNNNQIVGHTMGSQADAYLWDNGVLVNLHDHPSIGGVTSRAFDINDDGVIVGEAQFDISKPEEAAAWIEGVPMRLVPDVVRPQGVASAVNTAGAIVGYFNDLDNLSVGFRGVIWRDGERLDLLDMIDPALGWEMLLPFDINDAGQIVGGAARNGELGHAFLMTPIVDCPADVNGDNIVDVLDLLAVLAAWGAAGGVEDINGDGIVDVLDLLEILAAWGPCA